MRDQVVWVLKWLREAGMVECFEVEQNQVPIKVKPSEPSGNSRFCPASPISNFHSF